MEDNAIMTTMLSVNYEANILCMTQNDLLPRRIIETVTPIFTKKCGRSRKKRGVGLLIVVVHFLDYSKLSAAPLDMYDVASQQRIAPLTCTNSAKTA